MILVELIEGDGNRKKYRKGKNKQRQIKLRKKNNKKKKNKNKTKQKTEQVTSVIKIGICALIPYGEVYRLSLEIVLHCYMIYVILEYFILSAEKLRQYSWLPLLK